jgi:hypothetical protein
VFSWVSNTSYVQNNPLKWIGRSTVELVRESFMWETKGAATFFSIVKWVSWVKECCFPLSVFMGEEHNISKLSLTSEREIPGSSCKGVINVWSAGSSNLYSTVNWPSCLKEYCLHLTVFRGVASMFCKRAPFKWMEAYCSTCRTIFIFRSKRV